LKVTWKNAVAERTSAFEEENGDRKKKLGKRERTRVVGELNQWFIKREGGKVGNKRGEGAGLGEGQI